AVQRLSFRYELSIHMSNINIMKFLQINTAARLFLVTSLAFSATFFSAMLLAQENDATGNNQDIETATDGGVSASEPQGQETNSEESVVVTTAEASESEASTAAEAAEAASEPRPPKAESIDLKDVIIELDPPPPA